MVTESKSCAEDPQILGTSLQNLVAFTTWRPGFVHPWKGDLLHGFVKHHILHQQMLVECVRIFSTADLFVWLLVWNRFVCAVYILSEWFRCFEFGFRIACVIEIFCRVPRVVHDVNRMKDEPSKCWLPYMHFHMESQDS
jgi:hypothetical protein